MTVGKEGLVLIASKLPSSGRLSETSTANVGKFRQSHPVHCGDCVQNDRTPKNQFNKTGTDTLPDRDFTGLPLNALDLKKPLFQTLLGDRHRPCVGGITTARLEMLTTEASSVESVRVAISEKCQSSERFRIRTISATNQFSAAVRGNLTYCIKAKAATSRRTPKGNRALSG